MFLFQIFVIFLISTGIVSGDEYPQNFNIKSTDGWKARQAIQNRIHEALTAVGIGNVSDDVLEAAIRFNNYVMTDDSTSFLQQVFFTTNANFTPISILKDFLHYVDENNPVYNDAITLCRFFLNGDESKNLKKQFGGYFKKEFYKKDGKLGSIHLHAPKPDLNNLDDLLNIRKNPEDKNYELLYELGKNPEKIDLLLDKMLEIIRTSIFDMKDLISEYNANPSIVREINNIYSLYRGGRPEIGYYDKRPVMDDKEIFKTVVDSVYNTVVELYSKKKNGEGKPENLLNPGVVSEYRREVGLDSKKNKVRKGLELNLRKGSGPLKALPSAQPNHLGDLHRSIEEKHLRDLHRSTEDNRLGDLHRSTEKNRLDDLHRSADRLGELQRSTEENRLGDLHRSSDERLLGEFHQPVDEHRSGELHRPDERSGAPHRPSDERLRELHHPVDDPEVPHRPADERPREPHRPVVDHPSGTSHHPINASTSPNKDVGVVNNTSNGRKSLEVHPVMITTKPPSVFPSINAFSSITPLKSKNPTGDDEKPEDIPEATTYETEDYHENDEAHPNSDLINRRMIPVDPICKSGSCDDFLRKMSDINEMLKEKKNLTESVNKLKEIKGNIGGRRSEDPSDIESDYKKNDQEINRLEEQVQSILDERHQNKFTLKDPKKYLEKVSDSLQRVLIETVDTVFVVSDDLDNNDGVDSEGKNEANEEIVKQMIDLSYKLIQDLIDFGRQIMDVYEELESMKRAIKAPSLPSNPTAELIVEGIANNQPEYPNPGDLTEAEYSPEGGRPIEDQPLEDQEEKQYYKGDTFLPNPPGGNQEQPHGNISVEGHQQGDVKENVPEEIAGNDPEENVRNNPGESVGDNLGESEGNNLGENLGGNPGGSVGNNPGENLGNNPGENVGNNLGENLGNNPGESVGNSQGENVLGNNQEENLARNNQGGDVAGNNQGEDVLGENVRLESSQGENIQQENVKEGNVSSGNGPVDSLQQENGQGAIVQQENSPGGTLQPENSPEGTLQRENNQEGTLQSENNQGGTLQSENNPGETLQSQNNQGGTLPLENNQEGTLQSANNPGETLQSANNQEGTLQSADNQEGTLQSTDNQEGTLQSADNQEGTLQSADNQEGTLQSANNPGGTLQSQNNQGGTLQSANNEEGTLQSANNQGGTLQEGNNQGGILQMDHTQGNVFQQGNNLQQSNSPEGFPENNTEQDNIPDETQNNPENNVQDNPQGENIPQVVDENIQSQNTQQNYTLDGVPQVVDENVLQNNPGNEERAELSPGSDQSVVLDQNKGDATATTVPNVISNQTLGDRIRDEQPTQFLENPTTVDLNSMVDPNETLSGTPNDVQFRMFPERVENTTKMSIKNIMVAVRNLQRRVDTWIPGALLVPGPWRREDKMEKKDTSQYDAKESDPEDGGQYKESEGDGGESKGNLGDGGEYKGKLGDGGEYKGGVGGGGEYKGNLEDGGEYKGDGGEYKGNLGDGGQYNGSLGGESQSVKNSREPGSEIEKSRNETQTVDNNIGKNVSNTGKNVSSIEKNRNEKHGGGHTGKKHGGSHHGKTHGSKSHQGGSHDSKKHHGSKSHHSRGHDSKSHHHGGKHSKSHSDGSHQGDHKLGIVENNKVHTEKNLSSTNEDHAEESGIKPVKSKRLVDNYDKNRQIESNQNKNKKYVGKNEQGERNYDENDQGGRNYAEDDHGGRNYAKDRSEDDRVDRNNDSDEETDPDEDHSGNNRLVNKKQRRYYGSHKKERHHDRSDEDDISDENSREEEDYHGKSHKSKKNKHGKRYHKRHNRTHKTIKRHRTEQIEY